MKYLTNQRHKNKNENIITKDWELKYARGNH